MILPALGIVRGDVVSVAGAGGKTTLIHRLAAEARDLGWRVLVTTTTHMGAGDPEATGQVFVEAEGDASAALEEALARDGLATVLGRRVREDKLEGLPPARVDALAPKADLVLVEADGARGRSLKVPAAHEPVIPSSTSMVIVVCGLDVLGEALDEECVHRLELVAAATGVNAGEVVDEDCLCTALRHVDGYPSRIPHRARAGVFFNKADEAGDIATAARMAHRLIPPYRWVAAGSARAGTVRAWPPLRGVERH
jgi:probable selenium-dependent hydroxylase accessory protein YqeC